MAYSVSFEQSHKTRVVSKIIAWLGASSCDRNLLKKLIKITKLKRKKREIWYLTSLFPLRSLSLDIRRARVPIRMLVELPPRPLSFCCWGRAGGGGGNLRITGDSAWSSGPLDHFCGGVGKVLAVEVPPLLPVSQLSTSLHRCRDADACGILWRWALVDR